VARQAVITRAASTDDMEALVCLLEECYGLGTRSERAIAPTPLVPPRRQLRGSITRVLDSLSSDIVLALCAGESVGMAVVAETMPHPLVDAPVGQLSHLVVAPEHRRCGVGHALVAAAAGWAEDRGLEQLVANVYPSLREANRFYSRLGFAPAVMRRAAPVAGLLRRLPDHGGRVVDGQVLRRRFRRRAPGLAALHHG
jgi:GNAT superfamily N-acetyltransferase